MQFFNGSVTALFDVGSSELISWHKFERRENLLQSVSREVFTYSPHDHTSHLCTRSQMQLQMFAPQAVRMRHKLSIYTDI